MREYDVTITETLEKQVTVEATSAIEAEKIVKDAWNREDYVLGAEDFVKVEVKTDAEREMTEAKDKIEVLLVKPNNYPQKYSVGTELEDLQAIVGGDIEVIYPFEDMVGLIMNEEGKLNRLPLNRALRTEDGDVYDAIAGDFMVVGLTEDDFGSLTPELMDKYEKLFHQPETFIKMGRSVMAVPIPDDMVKDMKKEAVKAEEKKAKTPDWDCR